MLRKQAPPDGCGAERTIAVYTSAYKYLTTGVRRAYVAGTTACERRVAVRARRSTPLVSLDDEAGLGMAAYILGIDEGTTGARAFVINDQCDVLGLASAELTQHYPRPGWIEHDPIEILNVQLEVIRAALRQAKLQPSDLTAVALTNQRETGIVWEKDTGRPIHNAVVWASRQTVDVVEQWVEKGHGDMIEQRTGLIPDAYYTASKIRFILDAVTRGPGARRARASCSPAPSTPG